MWAIVLTAILIVAAIIVIWTIYDRTQEKSQGSPLSDLAFDELDLDSHPGIGFHVVYESDRFIIFWGASGLFGYDLMNRNVTFNVDFVKVFGEEALIQGSVGTYVEASPDGQSITIEFQEDSSGVARDAYYIDVPTLTYQCGAYEPMESIFGEENAVGYVMPGAKMSDTVYIRGDDQWMIFDGYNQS
jgi:hypothetical protein